MSIYSLPSVPNVEADAIWKLVALERGSTVLDLGCGHGRISNSLAERGACVTGVGNSSYFLDILI